MKTFEVASGTADEFVSKVKAALSGRELGKMTSISKSGNDISLVISKLGTSELRYSVSPSDSGFKAHLTNEKIALAHRAFRGDIEKKLQVILEKLGAKCG